MHIAYFRHFGSLDAFDGAKNNKKLSRWHFTPDHTEELTMLPRSPSRLERGKPLLTPRSHLSALLALKEYDPP